MGLLTIYSCDPTPHASFEEQWGAQLGEAQWQAEQDHEDLLAERDAFTDRLYDEDFEADACDEPDLERWTETCEPQVFEP